VFDAKSRYAAATQMTVQDVRGRQVTVNVYPPRPSDVLLGYHIRRDGQTLDHLAFKYLGDGDAFWRIAEFNDVIQAEILSDWRDIAIPHPSG
jgi:hypothetical protein